MADLQELPQHTKRPTQLSITAKAVVFILVATSFITGFMSSKLLEEQETDGATQSQLQNKIKQSDPELFGLAENNTASGPSGNTPKTTAGTLSFNWRGLHGLVSPFLSVLFGWLLFQHARSGWNMRANLWTGMPLAVVFGGLIVTGAFILYPELLFGLVDTQVENNWLKALHDLLGWLLVVGFISHLIGAKIYSKNQDP
jgi:hypothetical protein